MGATLTIRDLTSDLRRFEVDCRHATTTRIARNASKIGDAAVVAGVVLKHYSEEGCTCTRELRRQYPPTLLPTALWITV